MKKPMYFELNKNYKIVIRDGEKNVKLVCGKTTIGEFPLQHVKCIIRDNEKVAKFEDNKWQILVGEEYGD